ncbi:MAG: NADH-quinone oxidoreductase subunit L [Candidatus Micrarchaeia archaeon]
MLALLAILPLLIAALLAPLLKDHYNIVRYTSLAASLIALAMVVLLGTAPAVTQSVVWFSLSGYVFHITTQAYALNMLLLYIIAIITPLIITYSISFMDVPSEQARYYFELDIFATAMMLFAMAGNFITMFIGWEMLGITSYLLIGFWHHRDAPPNAARKAITIVFIGDMMMLAALVIVWVAYGTFSFSYLLHAQSSNALYIAMLLVMFAAFTKSAQFPFHEWLPDAMEGPTPVSAFLHSSTMVKAGVFIVAVLLPIYMKLGLGAVLIIFGIVTALIGMLNALAEPHIKRILAYSTIEDMGLMFVALGFGSLLAAMVLFAVQAFYKALLFMSAGTIMRANGENKDIHMLYGSSSYKPFFAVMLVGVLSIAGVFPISGFFGRLGVEVSATSIYAYVILLVIDFASSIYIFRWLLLPMRKPAASYEQAEIASNYRLTPKSMLLPQYVLAALVIVTGVLFFYAPSLLSSYASAQMRFSIPDAVVETLAVVVGALFALYAFKLHQSASKMSERHRYLFISAYNSVVSNTVYRYFAAAFSAASAALGAFDYALLGFVGAGGRSFVMLGHAIGKVENGQVNTYVIAFMLGVMLLLIMVLFK